MNKELLLYAEQVLVNKNSNVDESIQSQVFSGFSLDLGVECVVK
jgi:hypothetical protein